MSGQSFFYRLLVAQLAKELGYEPNPIAIALGAGMAESEGIPLVDAIRMFRDVNLDMTIADLMALIEGEAK
jgi:hypothetical protein